MTEETNEVVADTGTQPEGTTPEATSEEAELGTIALADLPEEQSEDADEHSEDDDKQKPSRSQRRSQKIRTLSEQNDYLKAEVERLRQWAPPGAKDKLTAPKEEDFPNDWLGYEEAKNQYNIRLALREERQAELNAARVQAEQEAHRERVEAYNERLSEVKGKLPDFDKVMSSARDIQIRDDIRDSIMESDKGPQLAYYFAKNPDALDSLNEMSPLKAAKELGKIEARLYIPKSKTVSKAPAPNESLKGGASPVKDLSSMSMEEYVAFMEASGG